MCCDIISCDTRTNADWCFWAISWFFYIITWNFVWIRELSYNNESVTSEHLYVAYIHFKLVSDFFVQMCNYKRMNKWWDNFKFWVKANGWHWWIHSVYLLFLELASKADMILTEHIVAVEMFAIEILLQYWTYE